MDLSDARPHYQFAPDQGTAGVAAFTVTANRVNAARFIPPVDSLATGMHVHPDAAATADDACDYGILGISPVDGELVRLCSTGAVTGRMNTSTVVDAVSLKKQPIAIPRTQLEGGQTYYAAHSYGTAGGTAATLRGLNKGNEGMLEAGLSMVIPGLVPYLYLDAAHPIPATLPAPTQTPTGPLISVSYARRIVAIGDSILGSSSLTGVPRTLNALLGRHALLLHAGGPSDTIALVDARIQADCHDQSPFEVIVQVGVNDIQNDRSASAIKADLAVMFADIVAYGGLPRPNTILPFGGFGGWSSAREAVRRDVNAWINTQPYPYTDTESMGDGHATQPSLQAGLTTDGIHPNAAGHRVLGKLIFDQVFSGRRTARL